jgi:hypothetical protein
LREALYRNSLSISGSKNFDNDNDNERESITQSPGDTENSKHFLSYLTGITGSGIQTFFLHSLRSLRSLREAFFFRDLTAKEKAAKKYSSQLVI